MKIVTVVGARPQFIKAAALSRILRQSHDEILIHTGQHYDYEMSQIFFEELNIPEPDITLNVGSGSHGFQTGKMLIGLEEVLEKEKPNWVLVYGDTNSTLAGALSAAKLHIPVAHIEAGLRSFNRVMPEEINRLVTDHLSSLLFCPSQTAVDNLEVEGIKRNVWFVGDIMSDILRIAMERAKNQSKILSKLGFDKNPQYLLTTIHRAENTDHKENMVNIMDTLNAIHEQIIFPVHPRTEKTIKDMGLHIGSNIHMISPVGYIDMVSLEMNARMIITDSGGIQKEAYWLGVPCITLRNETEWVETVREGWNVLVGTDKEKIANNIQLFTPPPVHPDLYGNGEVAFRCLEILEKVCG